MQKGIFCHNLGAEAKTRQEIPMATIAQIAEAIEHVLGDEVEEMARRSGFIHRRVVVNGKGFVKALVMAFQTNKAASYSEMSACASSLGMPMTAQGMEQRFDQRSAHFLKRTLEHALTIKLEGVEEQNVPLFKRFRAIHIRDSSVISLPEELKGVWKGVGGSQGETAALKLQVSWEQCQGCLDGIALQDGYCQDRTSPYQKMELEAGELHLADLGYYSLEKLAQDHQQGVLWLTRLKFKTLLWDEQGAALDVLSFLNHLPQTQLDISVRVGGKRQVACRLLASRVPQEVADQRRRHIKEQYRKKGTQPSEKLLQLARWTLLLTNVPPDKLSLQEALVLLKVRWQIELLFKLWKSYLSMDEWTSHNPWRILTEIYAKLLSAILFHWTILSDFWKYPDRSLVKAFKAFQRYISSILFALPQPEIVIALLLSLNGCYAKSCRINKHAHQACTFQALLNPENVLC
jgi:hypothetical protein